jgi:hypothetical protein
MYVKCSAAHKWRSTCAKQIKWNLYCEDEVLRLVAGSFVIVGDSKTEKNVAKAMVCVSVFVVSVNM